MSSTLQTLICFGQKFHFSRIRLSAASACNALKDKSGWCWRQGWRSRWMKKGFRKRKRKEGAHIGMVKESMHLRWSVLLMALAGSGDGTCTGADICTHCMLRAIAIFAEICWWKNWWKKHSYATLDNLKLLVFEGETALAITNRCRRWYRGWRLCVLHAEGQGHLRRNIEVKALVEVAYLCSIRKPEAARPRGTDRSGSPPFVAVDLCEKEERERERRSEWEGARERES